jgi:hypothetical protein
MQSSPADEAGINITLGRMTDEASRLIDDQQRVVFVNNLEKWIHFGWRSPAIVFA